MFFRALPGPLALYVLFLLKMAASLDGIFDADLQKQILDAKIFLVGAGGIGCELLKNLVLSGFTDIEVVSVFY